LCERCNTLQHTATQCSMLQRTIDMARDPATHCHALQHTATHCNTLQHTAIYCTYCLRPCNTLHHTTPHSNTLRHTATPAALYRNCSRLCLHAYSLQAHKRAYKHAGKTCVYARTPNHTHTHALSHSSLLTYETEYHKSRLRVSRLRGTQQHTHRHVFDMHKLLFPVQNKLTRDGDVQ